MSAPERIHQRLKVNGLDVEAGFFVDDRDRVLIPLLQKLTRLQEGRTRRLIVFLAAPPAAGKSTLGGYLELLSRKTPNLTPVQALGIDGFHYTNDYLTAHRTLRNAQEVTLRSIKGAPETYDAAALGRCLARINEANARWPLYDRRIHEPVPDCLKIEAEILLVEGNWLLLDEAPWNALACDYSVFLRAEGPQLVERVIARKIQGGFDAAAARAFAQSNDAANIRYCLAHSRPADLTIGYAADGRMEIMK